MQLTLNKKASRNQQGFTFVESLIAILITALVSGLMITGINASLHCLKMQACSSSGEMLAGSIDNALDDVYSYISLNKDTKGRLCKMANFHEDITLKNPTLICEDGKLYIKSDRIKATGTEKTYRLLNSGAYGELEVDPDSLQFSQDYQQTTISFTLRCMQGNKIFWSHNYSYTYRVIPQTKRESNQLGGVS